MIHGVGLIGGAIEVGAADACAVKDVVQPMVLPDWAQNSMLDIVERYRLTLNGEVGFVPRAEGKEWPHGENAFFLGVVEYDLNGLCVIEVDPISQLLVLIELSGCNSAHRIKILTQIRLGRLIEFAIGHAIDAIVAFSHESRKQ